MRAKRKKDNTTVYTAHKFLFILTLLATILTSGCGPGKLTNVPAAHVAANHQFSIYVINGTFDYAIVDITYDSTNTVSRTINPGQLEIITLNNAPYTITISGYLYNGTAVVSVFNGVYTAGASYGLLDTVFQVTIL